MIGQALKSKNIGLNPIESEVLAPDLFSLLPVLAFALFQIACVIDNARSIGGIAALKHRIPPGLVKQIIAIAA
jgi:hypothetical protein